MNRKLTAIAGVAVLLAGSGCGIFKSSTSQASWESSSRSSSSILSSSSPGDDEEATAFQRDIRDYTAGYVATDAPVDGFERQVGAIAELHGVTNWEAEPRTYVGMGNGLAQAGLDRRTAAEIARRLARADIDRTEWILSGYETRAAR